MASRNYFSSTSNLMQCNCVKKEAAINVYFTVMVNQYMWQALLVYWGIPTSSSSGSRVLGGSQLSYRAVYVGVYIYPSLSGEITFLITAGKLTGGFRYTPSSVRFALWLNKSWLNIIGFTWSHQWPISSDILFSVSMDKMYLQVGERVFYVLGLP